MSAYQLSRFSTVLVLVLACSVSLAVGQESMSGEIPGFQGHAGGTQAVPPGLDDALQPIINTGRSGMDTSYLCDTHGEPESGVESITLTERLENFDGQQRANAVIELELSSNAREADLATAGEIESLWNAGNCQSAIELLRDLEIAGVEMGLGIAWKTPQLIGSRGTDVRVGGPRSEAQTLCLDFDGQTGNLFSAIRWGSTSGSAYWTMNISTDDGDTWGETYSWASSVGIIDVDATVVDDFVYVAYVSGGASVNEGRIRRCLVATGAIDSGYGFYTVVNAGTNTVEDVALASNADDFDNRVYYLAIQSNDVLRFFWDAADDGTTFTDGGSPAAANAEFGLDATWDYNGPNGTCSDFLYVSYSGNDGNIHVLGRDETSWMGWTVESGTGSFRTTAVSAYEDTIICAFEYPYTDGTGIRYRISYNCGDSWSPGTIAVPDGASIFGYFEPDVDARDGDGTAIIYQAEAGELDPMYYRTRAGFAPGGWSDPALFSDYDVYTGSDTAISYLPPLDGEAFSHGAMYISLDPDFRTPYFDRPGASGAPCDDVTPPIIEPRYLLPRQYHMSLPHRRRSAPEVKLETR